MGDESKRPSFQKVLMSYYSIVSITVTITTSVRCLVKVTVFLGTTIGQCRFRCRDPRERGGGGVRIEVW